MRLSRIAVFALFSAAVLALSFAPQAHAQSSPAIDAAIVKGYRFEGANSCSTAKCHGGTEAKKNEYTIWADKDKHAKSFTGLGEAKGAEIAKKMGIASASTDKRCLECHSINVPEKLRGKKFDIADGNTCEQCHGPAGGTEAKDSAWLEAHAEKGWTKAKSIERAALDTKDMYVRADTCIPCHIGIDHEMIAAGHPYPAFELDTFSATMPAHWPDEGGAASVKAWAVGQAVGLRNALRWVAKRATAKAPEAYVDAAWREAHGRFLVVKAAGSSLAADVTKELESGIAALKAAHAAKDAAKLGTAGDLASKADALGKALSKATFDQAGAAKFIKAIAGESAEVAGGGLQVAEQITYSVDTLSKAFTKLGGKNEAAEKAINKLFEDLPEDSSKYDPAVYATDLKALAAAVP